ncbi:hypothetical protein D3C85_1498880 [compost metagenome]
MAKPESAAFIAAVKAATARVEAVTAALIGLKALRQSPAQYIRERRVLLGSLRQR